MRILRLYLLLGCKLGLLLVTLLDFHVVTNHRSIYVHPTRPFINVVPRITFVDSVGATSDKTRVTCSPRSTHSCIPRSTLKFISSTSLTKLWNSRKSWVRSVPNVSFFTKLRHAPVLIIAVEIWSPRLVHINESQIPYNFP